jgi:zeta-carotene isomerase
MVSVSFLVSLLACFLSNCNALRTVSFHREIGLHKEIGLSRNHGIRRISSNLRYPFKIEDSQVVSSLRLSQRIFSDLSNGDLIGEDAATFSLGEQSLQKWGTFLVAVGGILSFLFYVWIYSGGPLLGDHFKEVIEGLAGGDSTLAITYMLAFFAVAHSGLASLRPAAEKIVGARAWRYIFALVSLPLALSSIVYFINHRYDGIQLWDLRLQPGMHDFVWWSSLTSFLFLYPSTFNLLEVAAVDKPTLHLWETGITRITRHPQFIGQLIWCVAHTAYIGTSFMCATSAMLCAHHLFAVWNGDRRLKDKWGDKADLLKETTSVIPFAAIMSGKQELPSDYYKEFLRLPYLTIVIGSLIAYLAHPYMQAGATLLHW